MMSRFILFIAIVVFYCASSNIFAAGIDNHERKKNIECAGKSLGEVIEAISQQSGYRIIVSKDLLDLQVSGDCKNNDVEKLFSRILRGYNTFQIIDPEKKEIQIFTEIQKSQPMYSTNSSLNQDRKDTRQTPDDFEVVPGVSLAEAREKRKLFDSELQSGKIDLVLNEEGLKWSEVKEYRSDFDRDVAAGIIEIELEDGKGLREVKKSQEEFAKSAKYGETEIGENSGMTIDKLKLIRAETAKRIQSGETIYAQIN